jgi:hypothetical protein
MAKAIVESKGKSGRILRVDAPFDEALQTLRQAGCRYPISAEQLANARMKKGKRHSLSTNGSYTRHGFVYLRGEAPLIALDSPLLDLRLARKATQANRDENYFSTDDGEVYEKFSNIAKEDANKEPERRRVLVLPNQKNFMISASDNTDVLKGVFRGSAIPYVDFLGYPIQVYLVDKNTVNQQKGTLLTQMWLFRLGGDCGSGLNGNYRFLYCGYWVRGVSKTGEGTAQKVLPYTPGDVKLAEKELGRLARILQPGQLERLNSLVGKLKGE